MTLLQLQYFKALAHMLHYTKTAEELHISQPSLSYAISGLEDELGVKLFEKKNRKNQLTLYGEQFLPYVEQAIRSLEEGRVVLERMKGDMTQVVHLGYFQSLSASLIPSIIEGFYGAEENRMIRFDFTEEPSYDIFEKIHNGILDMGFTLHQDDWADQVCVLRQPLYLAVPADHHLARRKSVTFADFAREPLILLERSSTLRKQMDLRYAELGEVPNLVFEVRECNTALQYVSLKFGLAVVPQTSSVDSDKIALIPISEKGEEYVRSVYLTRNRAHVLSPSAQKVWEYIARNFGIAGK
jgi:DNA-binding transcriptional LysR family regulator